jgi:PKD repeat protein
MQNQRTKQLNRSAWMIVFCLICSSGFAADGGDDYCLDQFFGKVGPVVYSNKGKAAKISGELSVVMAMASNGKSACGYFVKGKAGKSTAAPKMYTLVFPKGPPHGLITGTQVVVNGKLNGRVLSVNDDDSGLKVSPSVALADARAVGGNVNVTVILVNFTDSTLAATPADIDTMINSNPSSLSQYYANTSNGKFHVTGTIKGPYTINYSSAGCNYGTWASAADAASGVKSGYRMYVLAPSGCGWGGLAYVGGQQSWINGSYWNWEDAYCHEFGHNLGMWHAWYGSTEYADHSDCMGNPSMPPHLNAPHMEFLGWTNSGNITNLSANGTYNVTLNAMEQNTTTAQIIKIPKADTSDNYYISYRAPLSLDAGNLEGGYEYGISVHTGSAQSTLYGVYFDGQTYSDTVNGITVTQVSHTDTTATVQVVIKANVKPIASMSASPISGTAPLPVNFDGTASSDPDGSIASYTWNFGDGTTGSGATISHTYTTPGTYGASLTVTDNNGAQGSSNVTITVADPNAINAPSNLTASASNKVVTLKWNDNSINEEGFSVERAVKSNNPVWGVVGTTTGTSFTQAVTSGTYFYRVRAYNNTSGIFSPYSNSVTIRVH